MKQVIVMVRDGNKKGMKCMQASRKNYTKEDVMNLVEEEDVEFTACSSRICSAA